MSVNVGSANIDLSIDMSRFNNQFQQVRQRLESIRNIRTNIQATIDPAIKQQTEQVARGLNTAVTGALGGLAGIAGTVGPAIAKVGTIINSSAIPSMSNLRKETRLFADELQASFEANYVSPFEEVMEDLKAGRLEVKNFDKALDEAKKKMMAMADGNPIGEQIREANKQMMNLLYKLESAGEKTKRKAEIMDAYGIKVKKATNNTRNLTNETVSGANRMTTAMSKVKLILKKFIAPILAAISVMRLFRSVSRGMGDNISEIKAIAQLNATIRTTGQVTGVALDKSVAFAQALERTTTIPIDNIIRGMALFATNTSLGQENLERATKAAADLSVVMGGDIVGASRLLNRALADPVGGLSRLQRAGVQFSEENRKLIQSFIEAGEVAKAQAVIFNQLDISGITGQAEAQVTEVDNMKRAWGDLTKTLAQVGGGMLGLAQINEGMARTFDFLREKIEQFANSPWGNQIIVIIQGIIRAVILLGKTIFRIVGGFIQASNAIQQGWYRAIWQIIDGINNLINAIRNRSLGQMRAALRNMADLGAREVVSGFRGAGDVIGRNLKAIGDDARELGADLADQWINGIRTITTKADAPAVDLDFDIDDAVDSIQDFREEITRTSQLLSGASSIWEQFATSISKRFGDLGQEITIPVLGELELDRDGVRRATAELGAVDVNLGGRGIGVNIVGAINSMKDLLHKDLQIINRSVKGINAVGIV